MPMAIPLLVYAGAQALGASLIVAQVAALAATVAVGSMEQRKAKKKAAANRRDLQIVLQSAVEPHRTVYGRAKLSGPLMYAHSSGADNAYLNRVIALTGHEIDAFEAVYFNDDLLEFDNGTLPSTGNVFTSPVRNARYTPGGTLYAHVEGFTGTSTQSASSMLITASGGQWTSSHRLRGRAYLHVQNNYSQEVYTEGLPNVQAVIRGKKLYDPRTGQTVWSRNPALVIRDYLTSVLQIPTTRIDDASIIAAANVCDETVSLNVATTPDPTKWQAYMVDAVAAGTWSSSGGGIYTQKRFTFDGVITADSTPGEVLEQMVFACAGYLSYTGGVWRLIAGSYTAPTLTLTQNDLRGDPQFQPKPPRRSLFNAVRGSFVGPMNKYQATDFPPLEAPTFVSDDGGTAMPTDIDLPFTNDAAASQRIASIYLYRSRQGVLSFPATLTGLALRPGDTVAITLPRFGFSGEVFRVEGWNLSEDLGVDLVLREEAASIYTWTPGASIQDPSPQLSLPNPWSVPPITGLTATSGVAAALVQNDGTIVQRTLVSWNVTQNAFASKVEIETRMVGTTAWTPQPPARDEDGQAYLLNLKTGTEHSIRARRVNAIGARSAWTTISFTPAAVNAAENLLRNSDWTEDLGYGTGAHPDARALSGWSGSNVGISQAIGRNFSNGAQWNVGPGGAWTYADAHVDGDVFQEVYQDVVVKAGVSYEASVYASIHRCQAALYVAFLDASKNFISVSFFDAANAGLSILGQDAYTLNDRYRLWGVTATAPANAVYARFVLRHYSTNSGTGDSYVFWQKAMFCVAPSGVTRSTATPWTDSGAAYSPEQKTQIVADGTSVPRIGSVFGDYADTHTLLTTLTYTPTTACDVNVSASGVFRWVVGASSVLPTVQALFGFSIVMNGVEQGETVVNCITEAPGTGRQQCIYSAPITLTAGVTYTFQMWARRPDQFPTTRSLYVDGGRLKLDVYRR